MTWTVMNRKKLASVALTSMVLVLIGYSTYANVTDGNMGMGVTADANGWYVYLANRSNHSVVAGFKAIAITN